MSENLKESAVTSPDLPRPRRRSRRRAIALALLILICGFALGSGTTVIVVKRMAAQFVNTPGEVSKRIAERMRRKLNLSDEQMPKVSAILNERETALRAILREIQPRIEQELELTREQVAEVLTPEQANQWRKRFDHLRNRWKQRWYPEVRTDKKLGDE